MTRPRIRTVLLLLNLAVLALPVAGVLFLRIYENELIRRTEAELLAQGACIVSIYTSLLAQADPQSHPASSLDASPGENLPVDEFKFIPALADLNTDPIRPPFPDPRPTGLFVSLAEMKAGAQLSPVLKDIKMSTLAGIRIVNPQGIIVATSGNDIGLSLVHADEVQLALKGSPVTILRLRQSDNPYPPLSSLSRGAKMRIFVAMPISYGQKILGVVLLSRTPRDLWKALFEQRGAISSVIVGTLLFVVLLSLAVSILVTRPVQALVAQSRALSLAPDSQAEPLNHPVTQEIAELSLALVAMAKSLNNRAEFIRTFALHVSHEFKTPLTSIQGAVELFQDHLDGMDKDQREKFLKNMAWDVKRLKNLVRRLLEYAKADVLKPSSRTADLATLLPRLAERYKDLGLTLTVEGHCDGELLIGPDILESVFTHLMDNSLEHGATAVDLRVAAERGSARIHIQDNGPGIPEAVQASLFTPFATTRKSQGGTGLGLVIVKTLLTIHKGSIEHYPSESGACFALSIPLA